MSRHFQWQSRRSSTIKYESLALQLQPVPGLHCTGQPDTDFANQHAKQDGVNGSLEGMMEEAFIRLRSRSRMRKRVGRGCHLSYFCLCIWSSLRPARMSLLYKTRNFDSQGHVYICSLVTPEGGPQKRFPLNDWSSSVDPWVLIRTNNNHL